ncbi:hypothetical protein EI94DRAFT_1812792 [Lactarius quietus]|nr:hypothetical protein EI94DRAFT_1812792 [Lactarius quietus]
MHATRQQFIHFRNSSWPDYGVSSVLRVASKLHVQDTSPELQHEFCALWNQIVRAAQNYKNRMITSLILRPLLHVYNSTHPDTDPSPTQLLVCDTGLDQILGPSTPFPVFNVPDHILDESASTTFPRTVLRNDDASPASPDLPSSPVPALVHVDECPTTLPPLGDSHHTHQTVENFSASVISPDPATDGAMLQDNVASDITPPYPTPETTSPLPLSSTSLPATIPLQDNVDPLTPSDLPNIPSSASHPILDNILSTEPHRSITVASASSASPVTTSVPAPGTVAEDDGSPKPGFHKDPDVLDPPLDREFYANLVDTPDLPPQSLSLRPDTHSDLSIAGRSLREPNVEHAADRPPPDPSRYQYDIV